MVTIFLEAAVELFLETELDIQLHAPGCMFSAGISSVAVPVHVSCSYSVMIVLYTLPGHLTYRMQTKYCPIIANSLRSGGTYTSGDMVHDFSW